MAKKSKTPDLSPYPSTRRFIEHALAAGLSVTYLDARTPAIYELSDGSHTILCCGDRAGLNASTNGAGLRLARDKRLTRRMLGLLGVPVAKGISIRTIAAAERFRKRVGRVVVKPIDAEHARGVTLGVSSAKALREAIRFAREWSDTVLVEQEVYGPEARLTFLDGKLLGAMRYDPPFVTGDDTRTVRELIADLEARRAMGQADLAADRRLILTDGVVDATLRSQKLTMRSVPAAGRVVRLRPEALLSRGGLAIDITDTVHPEVVKLALRATQALRLRFTGVDLIGEFDRPPRGKIWVLEVNSHPEAMMHIAPDVGQPRDVYGPILRALFPSLRR